MVIGLLASPALILAEPAGPKRIGILYEDPGVPPAMLDKLRKLLLAMDTANSLDQLKEALIKSHMRERSAFVPCIVASFEQQCVSIGTKALRSLVRGASYWVASAAASAALRALPRYLPWLRRDALHPSAPGATRVARLNQRFLNHFPGWKLHPLKGDLKGYWSLTVTGNWRLIFGYDPASNTASSLDLIDYHGK